MSSNMVAQTGFDSLHNIFPGKHFYQFYKNSDDFLYVMIPFFQTGLEKNEACLWLVSERNGMDFARATAEAVILDCERYLSSGQFQIRSAEEWYLTDGAFDEAKSIQNAFAYLEQMKSRGFNRFRASGDAGIMRREEWPKIEVYERKIGPWIKENGIVAICAYPILDCTPSQTKAILD